MGASLRVGQLFWRALACNRCRSCRAGFWRRSGAFAIDLLIAGCIIAVLGMLAFRLSGGRVQTSPFAFTLNVCTPLERYPDNLVPPPENSNDASDCSAGSFPGLTMTRVLVVGRKQTSPGREVNTSQSYPMAADGSLVSVFDASWIGQLGVLAYLAASLCRRSKTLGMRLLRIRMIASADPSRVGVPLSRVLIRFAVAVGGEVPAMLLGAATLIWMSRDPDHAPFAALVLATVLAANAWIWWNAILIERKRDPVYDRLARVAVIRD